jgi:hypothetical protein
MMRGAARFDDKANAMLALVMTDRGFFAALEYLHDTAARFAAATGTGNPDGNPISIQQLAHFVIRQVDICVACVRYQKTEAVRMR